MARRLQSCEVIKTEFLNSSIKLIFICITNLLMRIFIIIKKMIDWFFFLTQVSLYTPLLLLLRSVIFSLKQLLSIYPPIKLYQ